MLDIRLLGRFEVVMDGRPVPPAAWPQRRAADLVKVLALAPRHRLPRDAVLEALWPDLGADAAAANLHKAASYARRALGAREAIVLRAGMVELAEATTDVERFEAGDDAAYGGDLLPDDAYATWALAARERLRARRLELLRARGEYEALLREDPADEEAHAALVRRFLASGDRLAAARQLRRLGDELARLGLEPSPEIFGLVRGPAVCAVRLLDGPLEGRERELAAGSAALRRAADGRGGAVLVTGAMGSGKTRLIEEWLAEAEALGFHTLRGAAHEGPYAPLIEALDPLVAKRPELVAALTDSAQAALARLLPSLPEAGDVTRHRLFSAAAQLLAQAAAERGVVLAVDDLHAADEGTAALLHHLARAAAAERVLVVAALRDEPLPPSVAPLRSGLVARGFAVEVALEPLGRAPIEAIAARAAGRPLGGATLAAIARSAAGNPFVAEELAASVDAAGEVTVPPRLREVAARRLQRLEPMGERLRAALAVIGDGFTADELSALAGEPADGVLQAGVFEAVRGRYRFRHSLFQQELAARIPEAALREAHARAAELLDDAPPEAIAHHLLHAGREAEAVPLLARAAEWAAGVGAYRDGAEWAERALEHAPGQPDLLELRAQLLLGAGEPGAAHAYAQAIAAAPPERVPALRMQQARASLVAGDVAGARAALEGLEGSDGELVILRAMVAWHTGDIDAMRQLSAQAHRLAPNPSELATLQGMVAHIDGAWEPHSRRELTRVWNTPELAGNVFDGYLCVTEYVLTTGDPYDRIAGFAKRLRAQAQQAGARRGEAFAATVLGEIELFIGNLEAARAQLADAARLSREVGATAGESLARTRLGEALAHLGDRAGARAQLAQALELAHVSAVPQHLLFHVYAAMLQVAGDDAEALAIVDRAEALFDPRWVCQFCPTGFQVVAAGVCARAGALDRAREFLGRAEPAAAGAWAAAAAESRAALLLAEGDRAGAGDALRRAAEGYAAAGQLLNERRVRAALVA